jgi:hypothetical protein
MDKAELSRLLEDKVQEKLQEGYTITTYALDAASRDRVKRGLRPQSHPTHHDDCAGAAWNEYLIQLEDGEHVSKSPRTPVTLTYAESVPSVAGQASSCSGLWRVRRH